MSDGKVGKTGIVTDETGEPGQTGSFYPEPYPALRSSRDCANGNHSFCSGSRYVGERDGHPQYARCRCRCHG